MRLIRVPLIVIVIVVCGRAINADAYTVTNLYSFAGPFTNPPDGAGPQAGLATGFDGNFYGTTHTGGATNEGTVFRISPGGIYMSLYSFGVSPKDGVAPNALTQGRDTNFYGTAYEGGENDDGSVFRISPGGSYTNLYSFAGYPDDGANPRGGLVQGYDGNFYGTAEFGGTNLYGTVFRISPDGRETNLHSFAGFPDDGGLPLGGLVQGSDTNFYGTTFNGGISNVGTVFRINPDGTYTNLYSFGSFPDDGQYPQARLVQGSDGSFYGTTGSGGTTSNGTVFRISASGSYMNLYSFAGPFASPSDGAMPDAGLVEGSDTNFYGTTSYGGTHGYGTVFRISPSGSETNLHSFAGPSATPPDGQYPQAGLVQGSDTNFYGTTDNGGSSGYGTIFGISLGSASAAQGSLTVTISPPGAVRAGAQWQVEGGAFQKSGATVPNLSVGNHTVSFKTISGWNSPGSQTVFVSANSTAATSGIYVAVPPSGTLKVTITPAAAITVGAQWQVDGGTLLNSGATVANLSLGNHTVSFNTVNGWKTPANQTVSIKAKLVTKATGTYTFLAKGIYNGLFMRAEATEESSGMLSGLDVTASGTYTGKLLIGGSSNAINGSFNDSAQASNYVQRAAKHGGPLTLEMTLNWNYSPPTITGTVSGTNGSPWVANLTAELAAHGSSSAEYTALVLPGGTPPGYGCILITNHAGAVTLICALADGTSFSQQVPVAVSGDLPLYGNLYSSTGLLIGWIGLESGSPTGNLIWIKEASRSSAVYTNGFTNPVVLQGSPWTNPLPHTAAIDLPSGKLDISGGSLLSALSFKVAVSTNNALVKLPGSPTNSLTGSINPKTGLLVISFGNGSGKAMTVGTGVVLQNATNAAGFFLEKTNTGTILLQP
jgi:uncharacterized repeat protein (TIGR03803 family)